MAEKEKTTKKIVAKRVVLHFPKRMVDEPILYRLIKDYDLAIQYPQGLHHPGSGRLDGGRT